MSTQPNPWVNPTHGQLWCDVGTYPRSTARKSTKPHCGTSIRRSRTDPQDADPHDGDGESERHQQVRALAGAARCPAAAPTAGDVTVGHVTAGDVIGDHVTAGPQLAGAVVVRQTAPHASRPPWNIPPLVTDTSGRRGR